MAEIFAALGGVAALVAAGAFLGKLAIEKFADAALKRFDAALAERAKAHEAFVAFSQAIDTDLRDRRARVYTGLWKLTAIVSRWPRNDALTHRQVAAFARSMRRWYYETGGMYLSTTAREAYGDVQKAAVELAARTPPGRVDADDYDVLMEACSLLRTKLTEDLRSRGELPHNPLDA